MSRLLDRTAVIMALAFSLFGGLAGTLVTIGVSESRIGKVESELSKREQYISTIASQGRTLAILDSKYTATLRTDTVQDAKLNSMEKRLYIVEGNSKVTEVVLNNLTVAVKEFSQTTKALTGVLIRLSNIEQKQIGAQNASKK